MIVRDYYVDVAPIPLADGGGWIARVPDLPGCTTDADAAADIEAAVADAIETWIVTARRMGRDVPPPANVRSLRA